jgi:GNAT superfamily N-acetyltransferase
MSDSPVVIDQMKLSEKDEVLRFLQSVYPDNPRQSDPRFWDWHFPESPYCDPSDLPIWLARVDGRIAGQFASLPVEFNVSGETVRAIWILDMMVGADFRRRGIAKKLAYAAQDHCPFLLGVNTPKQHAAAMLQSVGWTVFTNIPRYQKILFPGNALREAARWKPVAKALNTAFAPVRTGYPTWPDVKRVESFDESFDVLWSKARGQWLCSVSRTSAFLDWQYCRQPGKKFEILTCTDGSSLRGYAVMFFRKPNEYGVIEKAAITDICYAPTDADETITMLLDEAVKLAIERQVGSVVTDAIDGRVERLLKHAGFWRVKSDLQLQANVPRHQDVVYDAANWYLTRGDSDISIFELPNV